MFTPRKAHVSPRCYVADNSEPVRLQDEISARLEQRRPGAVELQGPPGSGKSTALAHLAHVFGNEEFLLLADDATVAVSDELNREAADRFVVFTVAGSLKVNGSLQRWRLAPWTQDDCIEYLLSAHHEGCASVMRRAAADQQWSWLEGNPALCRVVLDRLAGDPPLADIKEAIRRELRDHIKDSSKWRAACAACDLALLLPKSEGELPGRKCEELELDAAAKCLLRQPQVQLLLAAEHFAAQLASWLFPPFLDRRPTVGFVREVAALIRGKPSVLRRLHRMTRPRGGASRAMAASLLHAAEGNWIPRSGRAPNLTRACLAGVQWPGVRLEDLNITGADLTSADLSEAQLQNTLATGARLTGARLHGASLAKLTATKATCTHADLSFVRAGGANFSFANLHRANLEGAYLASVRFVEADLRGARFCRANLRHADLQRAQLAGGDFTGASLTSANLTDQVLREAEFTGARFKNSVLNGCDLEYMLLPGANFAGASLRGAYLTGSRMPNAKFVEANLRGAGLAEIEWENADLRDADLRGSTFHMGSSRSGLVGSPIACEGSRTGFYTDEYYEQDYKSPEEIRKANLCGADLRGANIQDVDFYLVDLRSALYTDQQADHFRRCGAILEARV